MTLIIHSYLIVPACTVPSAISAEFCGHKIDICENLESATTEGRGHQGDRGLDTHALGQWYMYMYMHDHFSIWCRFHDKVSRASRR